MKKFPTILPKEITDKYDVIRNTFIGKDKGEKNAELEVEVGDVHSKDFKPQFKIMNWENETNMSVRLIDNDVDTPEVKAEGNKIKYIKNRIEAHFYDVSKTEEAKQPIESDKIRYIKRGEVSPESVVAEYELYKHKLSSPPTITTSFLNQETILFFGRQDANSYYDLKNFNLPIVRFNTVFHANPMYADNNLAWLTFYYSTNQFPENNGIELLQDSVIEALQKHNIEIEKYQGKLFYVEKGVKYKFFSSSITNERLHCYINFGTDYNRSMDLYKDGIEKDTYDPEEVRADGLWDVDSKIKKEIIDDIADIFIAKVGKQKEISSFTTQENTELQRLEKLAENTEWRITGERDDKLFDKKEGYEFEVILKEKPISNKIEMSIETKGLKFYHQSKLTLEEKFKGDFRPYNIVGSCAVYHESKSNHILGQKNYKAGKAFHIYRPKIIDSAGTEVWGKLNITDNLLTVEIPQEFLDNAVYPVRHAAGLTFGCDPASPGASWSNLGNSIRGTAGPANIDGEATKITAYITSSSDSTSFCCLYEGSLPSNSLPLVTNSQTGKITGSTLSGWTDYTFSTNPTLSDGTYYHPTFHGDDVTYLRLYYDSGQPANSDFDKGWTYNGNFPNPLTYPNEDTNIHSIYCTYTAGGAEAAQFMTTNKGYW